MTSTIISHIYDASLGMKKNAMELAAQMSAAMLKALFFEPTIRVKTGERPPKIMQVTSPKVMNTV